MLWILQSNLYKERGYNTLVEALERFNLEYQVVKPLPFTFQLTTDDADLNNSNVDISTLPEPNIDTNKPIIVMGSYTLARIAKQRGWAPGAFLNNLSYDIWSKTWDSRYLLNPNAHICAVRDAVINDQSFIRPVEDSKVFAGKVFGKEEFNTWKATVISMTDADMMNGDTQIIISDPVEIYTETRFFVVDGKIITSSGYKRGGHITYDDKVDRSIQKFADNRICEWEPDRAFVIDIAETEMGCKIVEVNNFNSAGFYACDTQKIVMAVEEMRL